MAVRMETQLMASFTWSAGTSGNWSDPANWTPSGIPGADDTATVSAAGSYVVQIDVSAIGSLILDAPDAMIDPVGSFALSGLLDVKAGTFSLDNAITITGGTIRPDGGTIAYNGGTFDGVTLDGPLDLSETGYVRITDGITFAGAAPEQVLLTGYDSELGFNDAETLNNVVVTMESTATLDTGTGLTLGASSTLTIFSDYAAPRSTLFGAEISGSLLDNKGTITVDGVIDDIAPTTINEGSLVVHGGGVMQGGGQTNAIDGALDNTGILDLVTTGIQLTVGGVLTNSGNVSLATDSTLVLDGGLANTGTITLAPGATHGMAVTVRVETDHA